MMTTTADSRQVRRQMARLLAKFRGYSKAHKEFLAKQGPAYDPARAGRPKLEETFMPHPETGVPTKIKVVTGWISPKTYPRQSKRQAARYAAQL